MIGGGVGGLSCARRLAQHGIETIVARGRHGRRRRERAERRLPDRRHGRVPQRRARAYGVERARAMYARTLEAQREVYRARGGARRGRRASGRWACCALAVSEEEAEHVRDHAAALREDGFPGETVEREDLPPALQRSGLVGAYRPRRRAPPRALVPAAGGAAEAGGRADLRGQRGERARARARRGAGDRPQEARARPARRRGRRRRASRARARVRGPRARRAGCTWSPPSRCRRRSTRLVYARWGYEYLQQRPDGRILAGGFSDVDADDSYTDSDAGSPADLGARRGLPARGPGREPRDHPSLGGRRRLQRRLAALRGRGARPRRPVRVGRLLGRGQRARLHVRARHRRRDRRRGPRAAVPGRTASHGRTAAAAS